MQTFFNIGTIAFLNIISIYHMVIWAGRRFSKSQKYILDFALALTSLSMVVFSTSFIPKIPLKGMSINLAVFFGMYFTSKSLKVIIPINKPVLNKMLLIAYFSIGLSFILTISSVIMGRDWYIDNLNVFAVFFSTAGAMLIVVAFLISAITEKKIFERKTVIVMIGFIFIFINGAFSNFASSIGISFFTNNYYIVGIASFFFMIALSIKFNEEYSQLHELSKSLEQKVIERTAELKVAKDTIEEQEKVKTAFFTQLMHHLKTPLSNIKGIIQHKRYDGDESIRVARRNASELHRQMEDYLIVEKYKNYGEYNYNHDSVTDLSPLVQGVVDCFSLYNLTSYIEPGMNVLINRNAFVRLLNCLLDNAIKYNREGVNILVKLKSENERVLLSVKDDGVGMSESVQANIFTPFYQLANKESNSQGIGMGLNVVKLTVDSAGGTIAVESKEGEGATFTCSFPLSSEKACDSGYIEPGLEGIDDKKLDVGDSEYITTRDNILIVEDNRSLIFTLKEILADYNIFTALNGAEALKRLDELTENRRYIDLILSDEMMDRMSGFEFIEKIRADERFKFIPFVFLTARTEFDDLIKGFRLGATDYIRKPFVSEEVAVRVKSHLEHKAAVADEAVYSDEQMRYDALERVAKSFGLSGNGEKYAIYATLGYTGREILEKLKVAVDEKSINKVNVTLRRAYKKVGVSERSELVRLFLEKENKV